MIPNTYPFNLIRAIYGEKVDDDTHLETVYLRGLHEQIKTLTEQQQQVLELRFQNGCTYQQGAETCGITREKFRQTIAKSLNRLRIRRTYFTGIPQIEVDRVKQENVRAFDENRELKQAMKTFNESGINPLLIARIADVIQPDKLLTPLHELGLSTRTLSRTLLLSIHTVKDALATPPSDFDDVSGFGEVSRNELQTAIRKHLLDIPDVRKTTRS